MPSNRSLLQTRRNNAALRSHRLHSSVLLGAGRGAAVTMHVKWPGYDEAHQMPLTCHYAIFCTTVLTRLAVLLLRASTNMPTRPLAIALP